MILEPLIVFYDFILSFDGVDFREVLGRWIFWDRVLLCKVDENANCNKFLTYLLSLMYRIILSLYSFQIIIVYLT